MEASIVVPRCLLVNCPELDLDQVRTGPQLLATRATSAREAVGLLYASPFRLILVRFPMPDMSAGEFVRNVRGNPGSRNKESSLVVIATPGEGGGEARALKGVNELLLHPVSRERLAAVVERFADVAPRRAVRMILRVRNELKPGDKLFFGQAFEVSFTGMLISLDRPLEIGVPLEVQFSLPGDSRVFKVPAMIVRGAMEKRITGHAYGVRFTALSDSDRLRLADFCKAG